MTGILHSVKDFTMVNHTTKFLLTNWIWLYKLIVFSLWIFLYFSIMFVLVLSHCSLLLHLGVGIYIHWKIWLLTWA